MIEGVVTYNGLTDVRADRVRTALWASVADALDVAA